MSRLNHTLRLGLKELTSLRHDSVLLLFLLYAFSVAIYMPAAGSHASLAKPCNRPSSSPPCRWHRSTWTRPWTAASTPS